MTRDQIDALWQQAMHDAIAEGEQMTRYHFAALVVAAEREACARLCDEMGNSDTNTHAWDAAAAIRARGAND